MPPPAESLASRLFLGPALRAQPDRRLVTLVREGYEAAFEEIVRRYGRPLGRYAASIVGGRSEDVLQEAFAKALPALRRDDAEIDLRPWLFRIVRNTALNDLRNRPPSPELLAEALAGGRDPAEELEQREQLADLMRRLRELPEPQRAAIVMRELEGLGHAEIAAALGLSGGGARQAIFRARQALRDGAGLLLPLPLLRLLVDHSGEAVGAGAGGALAAAGASAGGAGAGGALKLGVVAAVVAGSVGAGVAVQSHDGENVAGAQTTQAVHRQAATDRPSASPTAARTASALALSTAQSAGERHHSASGQGHGSGGEPGPGAPDAARPLGRYSDGPGRRRRPPRRHPYPGTHRGGRHGEPRGGEHTARGDGQGPGPGHDGEHSGPGGGQLSDGRHGGRGGENGSGGGGLLSPDGSGSRGGSESDGGPDESGATPPSEETAPGESSGSGGPGESGSSEDDSTQHSSSETGREYE